MEITAEFLEEEIKRMTDEREAFVAEANLQVAARNGAIQFAEQLREKLLQGEDDGQQVQG